jgi:hypothetical protein
LQFQILNLKSKEEVGVLRQVVQTL